MLAYAPPLCYACGRVVKTRLLRIFTLGMEAGWDSTEAFEMCRFQDPHGMSLVRECCCRMVTSFCPSIDDWSYLKPEQDLLAAKTPFAVPDPLLVTFHIACDVGHYCFLPDSTINVHDIPQKQLRNAMLVFVKAGLNEIVLGNNCQPRDGAPVQEVTLLQALVATAKDTEVYANVNLFANVNLMCLCDYVFLLSGRGIKTLSSTDEKTELDSVHHVTLHLQTSTCRVHTIYEAWAQSVAACAKHNTHCTVCGDAINAINEPIDNTNKKQTRCSACVTSFHAPLADRFLSNDRETQRRLLALRCMRSCVRRTKRKTPSA